MERLLGRAVETLLLHADRVNRASGMRWKRKEWPAVRAKCLLQDLTLCLVTPDTFCIFPSTSKDSFGTKFNGEYPFKINMYLKGWQG